MTVLTKPMLCRCDCGHPHGSVAALNDPKHCELFAHTGAWCPAHKYRGKLAAVHCPRVEFECGHVAFIWPDEYGDGSAWCQACGAFQCYDRCPECHGFDCDHRETR